MHRREDRQPALAPQLVDELEHLLLAADVERRGRLVEEQHGRLLRDRAREHRPLALAAAERAEPPGRERRAGRAAPAPPLPSRGRARSRARTSPRAACARAGRSRRPACRWGWPAPAAPAPRGARPAPAPAARPRRRRRGRIPSYATSPATARSTVVFPAPFGPISPTQAPSSTSADKPRDDLRAAEPHRDGRRARSRRASPGSRRSTSAKNGAPKNAVTTPIGSSPGEITVRAITSASTRNPAPAISESGSDGPVAPADEEADRVRDDDPDEADQPADGDRGGGADRGRDDRAAAGRADVDARGSRPPRRRPRARRAAGRRATRTTALTAAYGQDERHLVPARRRSRPRIHE